MTDPRRAESNGGIARRIAALSPEKRRLARIRLERSVASAFCDTFGRNGIRLDDDFLALGGRYRDACAIALRLSEELGSIVSPWVLTLYGTIERITIALTQQSLATTSSADDLSVEQLLAELESLDETEVASPLNSAAQSNSRWIDHSEERPE